MSLAHLSYTAALCITVNCFRPPTNKQACCTGFNKKTTRIFVQLHVLLTPFKIHTFPRGERLKERKQPLQFRVSWDRQACTHAGEHSMPQGKGTCRIVSMKWQHSSASLNATRRQPFHSSCARLWLQQKSAFPFQGTIAGLSIHLSEGLMSVSQFCQFYIQPLNVTHKRTLQDLQQTFLQLFLDDFHPH